LVVTPFVREFNDSSEQVIFENWNPPAEDIAVEALERKFGKNWEDQFAGEQPRAPGCRQSVQRNEIRAGAPLLCR